MKYTTYGSVRGGCGHIHRSEATAERCLASDQRDCRAGGGYSDRAIKLIGTDGYLYHDDAGDQLVCSPGGYGIRATD